MQRILINLSCSLCLSLLVIAPACGGSDSGPHETGDVDAPVGNDGDGGQTGPCTDGDTRCTGTSLETCSDGEYVHTQTCNQACSPDFGCVECTPGQNYCDGNDVRACTDSGQPGSVVETCMDGNTCSNGTCVDACAAAEAARSYIGCEYYAVDLHNAVGITGEPQDVLGQKVCPDSVFGSGASVIVDREVCYNPDPPFGFPPLPTVAGLCDVGGTCPDTYTCTTREVCLIDAQVSPFAVVVSNPQPASVDVTISDSTGITKTVVVNAGAVKAFFPQQLGFADKSLPGSGQFPDVYKIVSSAPVVAYQFNPLDNENVFSNDGSLLIPRTTYDVKYLTLGYQTITRRPAGDDYNAYVAIVAWQDDTQIRVVPTADTVAGEGDFAALQAGTVNTFTLNALDVLSLEAVADGDLTGTVIETTNEKTFGVFAGHESAAISVNSDQCCTDHLEEQMFPASTWGKTFAVARSQTRENNQPDMIRVLAQRPGTTVTFNPSPASGTCGTLTEGQFCEVLISADTEITATEPVLVGHFLLSSGGGASGDPAESLAVPTEQFRNSYSFLVPAEYQENYVAITGLAGATILLDGDDVSTGLTEFGSKVYAGGRISLAPGQHSIECVDGCGIEVMGYSQDVSYLFAGGLDLEQIVSPE